MSHQKKVGTQALNVFGKPMKICSLKPLTGFYRDGSCRIGGRDVGVHGVCAIMTEEFLIYTKAQGNDLSTPLPEYGFDGLNPGDAWCLCVNRWLEAYKAGSAPKLKLESCHAILLESVSLETLQAFSAE